jgi:hypothetical protein
LAAFGPLSLPSVACADGAPHIRYLEDTRIWSGLNVSLRDAVWSLGLDVYASTSPATIPGDHDALVLGNADARVRFPLHRSDGKPTTTTLQSARFSPVMLRLEGRQLEIHLGSIMQRRLGPLGEFVGFEPLMVNGHASYRLGPNVDLPTRVLVSVAAGRLTAKEAHFVSLIVDDTDVLDHPSSVTLTAPFASFEAYVGVRFYRRVTLSPYSTCYAAGIPGQTTAVKNTFGIDTRWRVNSKVEVFGIVAQDHDAYYASGQGNVLPTSWFRVGLDVTF